ncbi:tetratricopeptide repeat protein [Streptomyces sp. NPDC002012]|uniref:tetratricopeptide repeat protein n=1 Tax=Streptomyces sp. NPDC002012 TaxID=3154532 RepID=UPI00331B4417
MCNVGRVLENEGQYEEAITWCSRGAAISRETGDHQAEAHALHHLADALKSVGRIDESIAAWQRSVTCCQELGDERDEAASQYGLGKALLDEASTAASGSARP